MNGTRAQEANISFVPPGLSTNSTREREAGLQTTGPKLEETLKLAAHVMKEPRFDPQEFEQLKLRGPPWSSALPPC